MIIAAVTIMLVSLVGIISLTRPKARAMGQPIKIEHCTYAGSWTVSDDTY